MSAFGDSTFKPVTMTLCVTSDWGLTLTSYLADLEVAVHAASLVDLRLYFLTPSFALALLDLVRVHKRPAFLSVRLAHILTRVTTPRNKTTR